MRFYSPIGPVLRLFFVLFLVPFAIRADAASSPTLAVHGTIVHIMDGTHIALQLGDAPHDAKTYAVTQTRKLSAGMHIDALLHENTLSDITPSDGYTAGIPDNRVLTTLKPGDPLPAIHVIDQQGAVYNLSDAWLGKTVVLSFVYTRCPDAQICPAISGKFGYLQDHLDAARTHLVEITVDPQYDSPTVLAGYARRYGAISEDWSMLTGEQNQIGLLINRFGLSNLENQPGNFVHDDVLAIVGPDGKITDLIPTVGWAPDDVIATVLHEQGNETNPLRRLELGAISGIISLCGGSTTTGQVVLDSVVFVGGVLFFGGLLYLFGRRIWG